MFDENGMPQKEEVEVSIPAFRVVSVLENTEEKELAFQIADRYISIHEVEDGYDYSIMGADYNANHSSHWRYDGGVYDNHNQKSTYGHCRRFKKYTGS